jgi:chlororespiratory reduction 6-like protein^
MGRINIPESKKIATVKAIEITADAITTTHEVLLFDQNGDLGFFCDCGQILPETTPPFCYGIAAVSQGIQPIIRSNRTALRDVKSFLRGGGRLERFLQEAQPAHKVVPYDDESELRGLAATTLDAFVAFLIYKEQILACDTSAIEEFMGAVFEDNDATIRRIGRVAFSVDGYNDDPRELADVPEVRAYFTQLNNTVPSFFYYLEPASRQAWLAISCAEGYELIEGELKARFDAIKTADFVMKCWTAGNQRLEDLGLKDHPAIDAQDKAIRDWVNTLIGD